MLTQVQIDEGKAAALRAYARWSGRMLARYGAGSPEYRAAHVRTGRAYSAPRWHDGPEVRLLGHDWAAVRVAEDGQVIYALQARPGCCP